MRSRHTLFLFLWLVLFYSCTVYQKTSVPLSEAHDRGKVKVKTKSGETIKFLQIKFEDGKYYGLVRDEVKNERDKYRVVKYYIPITDNQAAGVYPKDMKKSKKRTILLATSPLMVVGVMLITTLIGIAAGGL